MRLKAWLAEDPFRLPRALFMAASWLLLLSVLLPYWSLTLMAPQYPGGLQVFVYVTHLAGDVTEVDNLNHYVGMKKLNQAAQVEKFLAPLAIGAAALLAQALAFTQRRWAAVLALPAMLFPLIFLGDMYFWLYQYGHQLDPNARCASRRLRRLCLGWARWGSSRRSPSCSLASGWRLVRRSWSAWRFTIVG
uniref:Hypothetical conserved protein n=1 Tax=Acetithermum autotrophicum TaxID=1446466 RepID=H5SR12_ACEAU|nr:hypothetical conserved protein [Candidatus Acetothermum autotrophicum]